MPDIKKLLKNMDWLLLGVLMVTLGFNLLVLYSASSNVVSGKPYYIMQRQLVWVIGGIIIMSAIALYDYHNYEKYSRIAYVFIIILLIGVLFMPEQKGAHRWYPLPFLDFQPSELAKVIIIAVMAGFFAKREPEMGQTINIIKSAVIILLPFLLILIEPDLGTSLVFLVIFAAMAWVGGVPKKLVAIALITVLVLVIVLFVVLGALTGGFQYQPDDEAIPDWIPLKGYQVTRLVIFINPYMDPLDKGYHMIQSQIAIGSGGFMGKGLGNGSQVQGNFLPEHHTDFIFSVVGEELGFVGTFTILGLYLFILIRLLWHAFRAKDLYGSLIIVGVVAMFAFQIFTNAGMTIGVMPVTGLPFPMLTYGGSSMLLCMICWGMVFSVILRREVVLF